MMFSFWEIFFFTINTLILAYGISITLAYLILAALSQYELRKYIQRNHFTDFRNILSSPLTPGISLIAPAYNEGLTIIDNVKSLMSIMYNNYEIIIINDGSKDDTLNKMIEAFNLVIVPFDLQYTIATKPVRGIYKSQNRAFKKLTVVDKENGGKADALNVGLNVSKKDLVACIDVDCIIEPDALLKMVKPFLESTKPVIASGGVVRIANSCIVEDGRLVEVKLPQIQIARFQVLEYIRAFLLGRMAWSKLNGLLLISGAFGLFKRDIAVKCGGYNHNTVGEDMELVVRMRVYMHKHNFPYKVTYIPDPLCWTEAPASYQILGRQRNRWARGTFEVLKLHRYLFFNPKYGLMGLVSYPFWFFFEWLAPFVEFSGLLYFLTLACIGKINWIFFFAITLAVYAFAFFISMFSLFSEETSYYKYTQKRDIIKMIGTALIEPLWFHPRVVWWGLKGNFDLIKGKKSWGEMSRQGFVQYKKKNELVR
ncbi:glycosyltransferase family 2 protein [Chryseotalea sanaruensis]|uniref:Glycosyltransferase family 2 protein n=1 Tax=Chryseotalea sanaruensis TaxID=2482724 RepID=A0A401U8X7_9BACT|nr:glycosyltransferase [Chryseotalea sanaruensis]GCC51340.1 glycosyltransferase family 2 protein [Chryseotalea sanaruensis]